LFAGIVIIAIYVFTYCELVLFQKTSTVLADVSVKVDSIRRRFSGIQVEPFIFSDEIFKTKL